MPLLLGLLVVEALVLRSMAHSPFSLWLLLEWPFAIYVTGLSLVCVWDRLATPKHRNKKVR